MEIYSIILIMYSIKLYLRNSSNIILIGLSLLANIFVWLWLLWQIKPQAEPIFLHYNILFGVDYIDMWWKVFYLPALGLLILLANAFLGWWLFNRDKFMAQMLNAGALLCQIFLVIAVALLVFLNV